VLSTEPESAMSKFQVGRTYSCRSVGDHDCVFSFAILSRTAQSVVINSHGTTARRKIRVRDGVEEIDPLGRYSMAPVLSADRVSA
jgi:hypothetical protein